MRAALWCILLFFSVQATAQNILVNGSFENYSSCPTVGGQLHTHCSNWYEYGLGTANIDYFHSCNTANVNVPSNYWGNEPAAHGNAYAGFMAYAPPGNREYFGTSFPPLHIGTTYEVSMSISLADNAMYGCNGVGVLFYKNGAQPIANLVNVIPQILYPTIMNLKSGWLRNSLTFVADSAYTNLIIGSFRNNSQITLSSTLSGLPYSVYYVDSVVIRPYVPFIISYPASSLCAGDTIYVPYATIQNTLNTGNVLTLELSGPTGSFSSPLAIGSLASTVSGTIVGVIPKNMAAGTGYRLRLVSTNQPYISFDNGYDLEIKPFPAVSASVNTPVCEGSSLNFSSVSLGGVAYSWTGPSFTSNLAYPIINNAIPAHSGDYIVTATLNGCVAKDTVSALVKPMPAIPAANNNGPLCEGEVLNLTAQSNMGNYSWTGPAFTSNQQNPQINNTTVANSGVYSVTASLNGCTSAAAHTAVTIKQMPGVPAAGSNSPVCTGGILNLSANSSTAGVIYDWTGPNNFNSSLQNPVIDPVPANAAGVYNVTASLNGCTSLPASTTAVVNTVTYLGAYASPNDTVCADDTLTVVTVPINGGNTPAFQWYKNNVQIPGATQLKYTEPQAVTKDTFYCRMIAGNVCNTPITLFSNKIGITVLPNTPGPVVSISSIPANPLPGNAVSFTASITNGGNNPGIQWLRNGQDIAGATSTTWSTTNLYPHDKISIRITSREPCPDVNMVESNIIEVKFPTGIQQQKTAEFEIYPNPNNGTFTLTGVANENSVVEILNMAGQLLHTETITPANGTIHYKITPVNNLTAGIYLLRITKGNAIRALKLVVK